MNIEFYTTKHGADCVSITDGNKHFDGDIGIKSPNGCFLAVAACWYIDIENDDDVDIEEIENSETLYVLKGSEIAYSIKGIDSIDTDNSILFNDGRMVLFDEKRTISFYSSSGNVQRKKTLVFFDYGIENSFAWFFGESDAGGNYRLQIIDFNTMKSWTKQLRDEISGITNVSRTPDGGFVATAETYDNEHIELSYDADGKLISSAKRKIVPTLKYENEINSSKSQPKPRKKKIIVAVIVGVIFFILALIGKLMQ